MQATDRLKREARTRRGRRGHAPGFLTLAAVTAVALAGCKEQPRQQAAKPPPPDLTAKAEAAAREAVAAGVRAPAEATFRAIRTWRQAIPRTVAVCGQVNPTGSAADPFVPFVAVIEFGGGRDPSPIHIEQHAATTNVEATRVYGEMVARCLDDGGPRPLGPHHFITEPLPPMPDGLPRPEQAANPLPTPRQAQVYATTPAPVVRAPVETAPAATVATMEVPPGETAVPRQNVNLHTEPHGPVSRVVPKGAELRVFAQAAGGWYEVGDEARPWGWIHGTMLDVH